jgi:hypothetical protein
MNPAVPKAMISAAQKALEKKFDSSGVVKLIGKPTVTFIDQGKTAKVSGKVDVNALWGGDAKYSFEAKVNLQTGKATGLRTKIFQET